MENKNLVVAFLVIGVSVGGFFIGMKYQQNKQFPKIDFRAMRDRRRLDRQGFQQRGISKKIRGKIISQDEKSITVELPDGSSKIILISENTKINRTTEGSVNDLEVGKQIVVFGEENSDKSISAANIQLSFKFNGGVQGN